MEELGSGMGRKGSAQSIAPVRRSADSFGNEALDEFIRARMRMGFKRAEAEARYDPEFVLVLVSACSSGLKTMVLDLV